MKLTLVGGGGVRAPLFVTAAIRRADRIHLDEICLMDIDEAKLAVFGTLSREIARMAGSPVRITSTREEARAFDGADFVVTAIRVGGDHGRVLDEQIALRQGVLGQETTGPGGFAMALRSIPALIEYAEKLASAAPAAWMLNFTNPAGLVAQALSQAGFDRAIGICDGANSGQHAVAEWTGTNYRLLRAEVFGLNHLSWTRNVWRDGEDLLPPLLRNDGFLSSTLQRVFDPELVRHMGMWLNEYLYYYYHAERALASLTGEDVTRGVEVERLNHELTKRLQAMDIAKDPQAAMRVFAAFDLRRTSTYMYYAQPGAPSPEEADRQIEAILRSDPTPKAEGYAGVALDVIEALTIGEPIHIGLNVPNRGAIDCMRPDDIVEVTCVVDRGGIRPVPVGAVPGPQEMLMRAVKLYETLTVQAIRTRSRKIAIQALMAHPLVLSYSRSSALVDGYLRAHAPYVGTWAE
jgi:6-phospho-beta-glucosidase